MFLESDCGSIEILSCFTQYDDWSEVLFDVRGVDSGGEIRFGEGTEGIDCARKLDFCATSRDNLTSGERPRTEYARASDAILDMEKTREA